MDVTTPYVRWFPLSVNEHKRGGFAAARRKMATGVGAVNLNINLRKDVRPEELLKELVLSPLIYIRLAGIVSQNL